MILAFDTSNYTTSLAIVDGTEIVVDNRRLINVKHGERGIRQSDAFFQHMQVLDEFVAAVEPYFDKLEAIAVSTRPRPVDNSYMPVFRAGQIVANALSRALKLPLYCCSHQEGHLYSALRDKALPESFLFLHLSGGTTEIHRVDCSTDGYRLSAIAETADISVGQLIDRIGVNSGLSFPCGRQMDELALPSRLAKAPRFKVKRQFNLSGYENYFNKLLREHPAEVVYYHLFMTIESILADLIARAVAESGISQVLLAGGVAENSYIRDNLLDAQTILNCQINFATSRYASDNAVGVAEYARHMRRQYDT